MECILHLLWYVLGWYGVWYKVWVCMTHLEIFLDLGKCLNNCSILSLLLFCEQCFHRFGMHWEDWCWMCNIWSWIGHLAGGAWDLFSLVHCWIRFTCRYYLLIGCAVYWLCLMGFWRSCIRHWSSHVDYWVILLHYEAGLQDVHEECLFSA